MFRDSFRDHFRNFFIDTPGFLYWLLPNKDHIGIPSKTSPSFFRDSFTDFSRNCFIGFSSGISPEILAEIPLEILFCKIPFGLLSGSYLEIPFYMLLGIPSRIHVKILSGIALGAFSHNGSPEISPVFLWTIPPVKPFDIPTRTYPGFFFPETEFLQIICPGFLQGLLHVEEKGILW